MSYLTQNFIDALHYEAQLKELQYDFRDSDDQAVFNIAEAALVEHWQLVAVKKERDEIKAELEFAQNENTRLEKERDELRDLCANNGIKV